MPDWTLPVVVLGMLLTGAVVWVVAAVSAVLALAYWITGLVRGLRARGRARQQDERVFAPCHTPACGHLTTHHMPGPDGRLACVECGNVSTLRAV